MIVRDEHNDNYLVVSYNLIRSDLSDGAKVLLLFMLTCSDDWNFSVAGLASVLNLSTGTVSARLKELQKAGYLQIRREKNNDGVITSCAWTVRESPRSKIPNVEQTLANSPRSNLPNVVLPNVDLPNVEKLNGKEITNIRNNNKRNNNGKNILSRPSISEIADYCSERNNGIDPQAFFDYYEANGWVQGKSKKPVKDWKACVRTWESRNKHKPKPISDRPKTFEELLNEPPNNPFTDLLKQEGYSI